MGDQGKWFKLWNSAIEDPDLENLELEDWARWAKLGAFIKAHGVEGKIRFPYPYRKLLSMFRITTIEAAKEVLNRFPNVRIGERSFTVTPVTNEPVTLEVEYLNWFRYQGDFSGDRVRKWRDKKRHHVTVQEEKRSRREVEEKRKEEIPPKSPFTIPTPEEVTAYAKSQGFVLDGARFCAHYEAKGWMIGKNKMRNWKAAVITWRPESYGTNGSQSNLDLKALARAAREAKAAREHAPAGALSDSIRSPEDVQPDSRGSNGRTD